MIHDTRHQTPQFKETTRIQRSMSNPENSAWLTANAGSGKTKVLIDRVTRLLLAGAAPEHILCITFTKAAAAEMAERLFDNLGKWSLLADESLRQELRLLSPDTSLSAEELSKARKLFARALETPGGLKIQTIHAFSESILRRFPVEANLAPGFTVLDDLQANILIKKSIDELFHVATITEGKEKIALDTLAEMYSTHTICDILHNFSTKMSTVEVAVDTIGTLEKYFLALQKAMGLPDVESHDEQMSRLQSKMPQSELMALAGALRYGTKKDNEAADNLDAMSKSKTIGDFIKKGQSVFLTAENQCRTERGLPGTKDVKTICPNIKQRLMKMQNVFYDAAMVYNDNSTYHITKAIYTLGFELQKRYLLAKSTTSSLDFSDLVSRTAQLFSTTSMQWVLYKLDQRIKHILLDEAQDTSARQWEVIMAPLREFFAGDNAHQDNRTVFVVGDEKQSIYSFQGADVRLFLDMKHTVYNMASQSQKMTAEEMGLSFRSAAPILAFVDTVFSRPDLAKGVVENVDGMTHQLFREGDSGFVELWPLVQKPSTPSIRPWDIPLDALDTDAPETQLAREIVNQIKQWLESGEILTSLNRPIQPGDILILCHERSDVFDEIIRHLIQGGIPTAGTDRLKLIDYIGVQDLISLGKFCLCPDDDLSLAETLTSPLFDFSQDDLFAIACDRGPTSLWVSLAHSTAPHAQKAVTCLRAWQKIARLRGPFDFYTSILETGNPSGWMLMSQRLGVACMEPLKEFLSEALTYEASQPRCLQGFLAYIAKLEKDIRIETESQSDLVRIMTVHGAKGLQSNIVIMADIAHTTSKPRHKGLIPLANPAENMAMEKAGYFIYPPAKKLRGAASKAAVELQTQLRDEESRRLFYVAATRARDRLYLCGRGNSQHPEKSWYAFAQSAFATLEESGRITHQGKAPWGGDRLRFGVDQLRPFTSEEIPLKPLGVSLPAWARAKPLPEKSTPVLIPSHLSDTEGAESAEGAENTPIAETYAHPFTPLDVEDGSGGVTSISPLSRGVALHTLLEILPGIPADQRPIYARNLLCTTLPDLHHDDYDQLIAEISAVLDMPVFSDVFGPHSKAEVPLIGTLRQGTCERIVQGQIDRLCVQPDKVTIVDYKTNRRPPAHAGAVPQSYIRQLAIYRQLVTQIFPNRAVHCALLWTYVPKIMPIDSSLLDHAFAQLFLDTTKEA